MPESEEWVYRAVDPQWVDSTGRITAVAFSLRPLETELSVYSTRICRPYDVLQRLIDPLHVRLAEKSGQERVRYLEWMDRKGSTVERRVEFGWQVARLPISAFTERGFEVGEVEPNGHIGISGLREAFERYADVWADMLEVVPVEVGRQ
jgi:hypothetical protein